jgi:hypothetical protein
MKGIAKNLFKYAYHLIKIACIVELSLNSTNVWVGSYLFAYNNFPCLVSFSCMHGVDVEVSMKNIP